MKQSSLSHQHSFNKENNRNSLNRKGRDSIGSQHDDHLISKLIPDFGLSALTRNISELLDLPERTDLNRANDGDGSCDIFSSNVIDVVKDLGQEVTKSAQDITVKTAQDISKTAQDLSKSARAIIPLPASLSSSNIPAPIQPAPEPKSVKVKAPRNYNVNFIFTEVERSREEEFLDLSAEDESEQPADTVSGGSPSVRNFRTPTKTYEQQDMFNLLYTPATCYSQSSRCSGGEGDEPSLDQGSFLNQSIVSSAAKSVHSLEDSPLKLDEETDEEREEEVEEEVDEEEESSKQEEDLGTENEVDEAVSESGLQSPARDAVTAENEDDHNDDDGLDDSTPVAPEMDTMDLLLQTLFDGEVPSLVCYTSNGAIVSDVKNGDDARDKKNVSTS